MDRDITDMEASQPVDTKELRNLAVNRMRQGHHRAILRDLGNRTAGPSLYEKPPGGPEPVDFGVFLDAVDAVQVIFIVEGIGESQ